MKEIEQNKSMPLESLDNYLTVNQASKYLGVSASTLRNWDKTGRLKAYRHPINGYRLYSIKQLNQLLSQIKIDSHNDTNANLQKQIMMDEIEKLNSILLKKYKYAFDINYDLNRKMVSFQANKNIEGYRWFKYKEGFSAALIKYILHKLHIDSGKIIDPFAGAGTTLFAAADEGIDADGIELLPIGAEIIDVRKSIYHSNNINTIINIISTFNNLKPWDSIGEIIPFNHLNITAGAFPQENEYYLSRYLFEINKIKEPLAKRILKLAALAILEDISYTRKDGQYLRWDHRAKRGRKNSSFYKGEIPTFTYAISNKLIEILDDLRKQELLAPNNIKHKGNINLYIGSSLELLPQLEISSYDALITSPPYCNRYDYTRTYALELAMLGKSEDEIKTLRQMLLSSTVENKQKDNLNDILSNDILQQGKTAFNNQYLLQRIIDYLYVSKDAGTLNNNGIPRMVKNYFYEMSMIIAAASRILKKGAPLVMVNDNVRYDGIDIPVDLILSDIAANIGFSVEKIWVLPKGKGNSSQQMGVHGRKELRKCIYIWRKL